jgi:hypothetical protein
MWPDNGQDNQKWHFDDDFTIRSETGSVLDVKDSSVESGAPIIAFGKTGGGSQNFRIVPVPE